MNIDRRIRELEKEKNQITNAIHYWDDVMKDGNISYMEREETDETIISLNVSRKAIKRLLEKLKIAKQKGKTEINKTSKLWWDLWK